MANGKLSLAPSEQQEKIKKVVTKKLYGHQRPKKSLHDELMPSGITIFLDAIMKVYMIFPAILIGVLSGIGAAFEIGLKKAIETYKGK
jgi:hypothetical protein